MSTADAAELCAALRSPSEPARLAPARGPRALQHHGYGGFGGGAHFTMSGSRAFHKGNKIKGLVQRKAGGTKTKAAQAAAARGKSKTSR